MMFLVNIKLTIDYDYLKPNVVFVTDCSRSEHNVVAESRTRWLGDLGLDCVA